MTTERDEAQQYIDAVYDALSDLVDMADEMGWQGVLSVAERARDHTNALTAALDAEGVSR